MIDRDELRAAAKKYGEDMRVLRGQFVGTAERLAMAYESGALWMQSRKHAEVGRLQNDHDTVKAEMHRYRNMWLKWDGEVVKLRERVAQLQKILDELLLWDVRNPQFEAYETELDKIIAKAQDALDAVSREGDV